MPQRKIQPPHRNRPRRVKLAEAPEPAAGTPTSAPINSPAIASGGPQITAGAPNPYSTPATGSKPVGQSGESISPDKMAGNVPKFNVPAGGLNEADKTAMGYSKPPTSGAAGMAQAKAQARGEGPAQQTQAQAAAGPTGRLGNFLRGQAIGGQGVGSAGQLAPDLAGRAGASNITQVPGQQGSPLAQRLTGQGPQGQRGPMPVGQGRVLPKSPPVGGNVDQLVQQSRAGVPAKLAAETATNVAPLVHKPGAAPGNNSPGAPLPERLQHFRRPDGSYGTR
jgi:hypothetical protein